MLDMKQAPGDTAIQVFGDLEQVGATLVAGSRTGKDRVR